MLYANIYLDSPDFNPANGAVVMFVWDDRKGGGRTLRGFADKPAALAEAKRLGARVV